VAEVVEKEVSGMDTSPSAEHVVRRATWKAYLTAGSEMGEPLFVELMWRSTLAIEVIMLVGDVRRGRDNPDVTEWRFTRDLLALGGGEGDVRVFCHDCHVFLRLIGETTAATVAIPTEVVREFLGDAEAVTPRGQETSWLTEAVLLELVGGDW
jgi:Streptomyces sporulation and cell division protein, SsgA